MSSTVRELGVWIGASVVLLVIIALVFFHDDLVKFLSIGLVTQVLWWSGVAVVEWRQARRRGSIDR